MYCRFLVRGRVISQDRFESLINVLKTIEAAKKEPGFTDSI